MARDCNKGIIILSKNNRRENREEDRNATIATKRDISRGIVPRQKRERSTGNQDNRGLNKVEVNAITAMKLDISLDNAQVKYKTIQTKRDWYSLLYSNLII